MRASRKAVASPMKAERKVPNSPRASRGASRGAEKDQDDEMVGRRAVMSPRQRKRPAPQDEDEEDPSEVGAQNVLVSASSANHNKYCHFCQHVKVRASSMLACEDMECCRRFCEHCLLTHLNEDIDRATSNSWSLTNGKEMWLCPICRKRCCCSVSFCEVQHRHCKAYRYRRRRAELAIKRMSVAASLNAGDKRAGRKAGNARQTVTGDDGASPGTGTPKSLASGQPASYPGASKGSAASQRAAERAAMARNPLGGGPSRGGSASAAQRREVARARGTRQATDDRKEMHEGATDGEEGGHSDTMLAHLDSEHADFLDQAPRHVSGTHDKGTSEKRAVRLGMGIDARGRRVGLQGKHLQVAERGGVTQDAGGSALAADMWTMHQQQAMSVAEACYSMQCGSDDEALADEMLGGMFGTMPGGSHEKPNSLMLDDCPGDGSDLDEALWLRRTYERVYNPRMTLAGPRSAPTGRVSGSSAASPPGRSRALMGGPPLPQHLQMQRAKSRSPVLDGGPHGLGSTRAIDAPGANNGEDMFKELSSPDEFSDPAPRPGIGSSHSAAPTTPFEAHALLKDSAVETLAGGQGPRGSPVVPTSFMSQSKAIHAQPAAPVSKSTVLYDFC